mgnify:CR=1 FL=1
MSEKDKYLKKHNNYYYFSDDLDGAPIKVGARIIKRNSEEGDNMPNGAKGKVIGSISQMIKPDNQEGDYCYTVVWSGQNLPIGTIGKKIEIDKSMN